MHVFPPVRTDGVEGDKVAGMSGARTAMEQSLRRRAPPAQHDGLCASLAPQALRPPDRIDREAQGILLQRPAFARPPSAQGRHIPLYRGPWHDDQEEGRNSAERGMPSPQHSLQNRCGHSWGSEGEDHLGHNTQANGQHSQYEQNGDESDHEYEGHEFHYSQSGEDNIEKGESDEEENVDPSQSSPQRPRVFRERTSRRLPLPKWCSITKPTKVIKKIKKKGEEQNGVIKT